MADTYAQAKAGFLGFGPTRPFGMSGSDVTEVRSKLSSSTFDIKKGHPLIVGAGGTIDRAAVQGVNEVTTLTITNAPTGGSFTLTYAQAGASNKTATGLFTGTTDAIAYNATAAQVQTALEEILGVGNVECAGGPFPGTAVTVEYIGELCATNITAPTDTESFTGGSSPANGITTTTAGTIGLVTSNVIYGFSESNDVSPIANWPSHFPQAPLNLDGPFSTDDQKILIHKTLASEVFIGNVWYTETVATSMLDVACSIGWDADNQCCMVRTGDTSEPTVRPIGIPDGELGKIGGRVYFVIEDGRSSFH